MKDFSYSGCFKDARLDTRCEQIAKDMYVHRSSVIQQFSKQRKRVVSSSRFFNNKRVRYTELEEWVSARLRPKVKGKELLCIEDTTELNYTHHRAQIAEGSLGAVCKSDQIGFFIHPTLVLDKTDFRPLGICCTQLWTRQMNQGDKYARAYHRQELEQKESYRWIKNIERSKSILSESKHKIVIADREADIYALYTRLQDDKTDIIVRMCSDRALEQGGKVRAYIEGQPIKDRIRLKVKADAKDQRSAHIACLTIKYTALSLKRPAGASNRDTPKYFTLYAIQVKEELATVKAGEKPIEWLLLTTLILKDKQTARKTILYYSKRWMIEEFFALLKTRGLNLEASQIHHGKALMNLSVIAMDVSFKILQLTKGRDNEVLLADEVFSKKEIALIGLLIPQYEGKTQKQKNNYKHGSLAWAAWLIGRMGGWMGYSSESPPGNKTMKRGLDRFYPMVELAHILK